MLKHFLCALHFTPIYMQKYLIILYYKCLKGLNNKDTEGQLWGGVLGKYYIYIYSGMTNYHTSPHHLMPVRNKGNKSFTLIHQSMRKEKRWRKQHRQICTNLLLPHGFYLSPDFLFPSQKKVFLLWLGMSLLIFLILCTFTWPPYDSSPQLLFFVPPLWDSSWPSTPAWDCTVTQWSPSKREHSRWLVVSLESFHDCFRYIQNYWTFTKPHS